MPGRLFHRYLLWSLFALWAGAGIFVLSAKAQDEAPPEDATEDIEEIEVEPIIVIGDRITSEREVENPTRFMTVVDTSEASNVSTAGEQLESTVGVQINSFGGMGGMSTVSIRGSSPSQVQVYLDGIPMNRATTGVANIGDIPLDGIDYIEVYRGSMPADFGQAGIGGAVNFVTKKGREKAFAATSSYGSFETMKTVGMASGPAGPVSLFMLLGFTQSRGDFEYDNDNGTPLQHGDDFTATRKNNDFTAYDLTFRVSAYVADWEITGVGTGYSKEQGLPGLGASQALHARLENERGTLAASARNRNLLSGRLDITFGADGLYETETFRDPRGELGTGGSREVENRMDSAAARVKTILMTWDKSAVLTVFGEARQERYLPIDLEPDRHEGNRQSRVVLTGVLQLELTDPTANFTVQAAVRHERYINNLVGDPSFDWSADAPDNTDVLDLTSPSCGAIYRVTPRFFLKGNAGKFYRVPTFYELFGDRGYAIGNTELKPEQGVNFDIGFVYHAPDLGPLHDPYVEYAFFQSRVSDMIVFFQNSQRTVTATNIGEALIGGHELAFGAGIGDYLKISGNYTFQSPVDRSDVPYWRGNMLPMRPMHEAFVRVEYTPVEVVRLWADYAYISGNYWDRANLYEVPDRQILNLGAWFQVYSNQDLNISVSPEVKNATDDRVSDVAGYPLPGRSWFITMEAKW